MRLLPPEKAQDSSNKAIWQYEAQSIAHIFSPIQHKSLSISSTTHKSRRKAGFFKVPPTRSGRLINAVASIGYDPEVALCDLMDNSIDADAQTIQVVLVEDIHEKEGQTDKVGRYIIADDGSGMEEDQLINAFTLGAEREYPGGSLGKFGLGLKSAGLALGSRITLVSKTASSELCCAVLSMSDVLESGEYRIDLGSPPGYLKKAWEENAPDSEQGTVLVIDDATESRPAFDRFKRYFARYCSNTYHLFLERTESPLRISVNGEILEPIDPLFMSEAKEHGSLGNPGDWDGRSVRLLLDDKNLPLSEDIKCTIAATHLVHPPTFEEEGKRGEMRDHYQIETDLYTRRPRHGFFIYRNRRIIVQAERFHGLVSSATQAWAFRGRLMFDESADEVLALDVKKRHMKLPTRPRNNLKHLIANHQSKSIGAWKAAGRRYKEWKKGRKDEAANQSIAQTPVSDLQYAPGTDLSNDESILARQERMQKVSVDTLASIQDPDVTQETFTKSIESKDVLIKVEGIKGNAMWLPYPAVELGRAETVVNVLNSWNAEAFAVAEEDPKIAIILYQLFTILSRAELEVQSTPWPDVPESKVAAVLERYRRKASAIGEDLADSLAAELRQTGLEEIDED